MNQTIKRLQEINQILIGSNSFPAFSWVLDESEESLSITITDSGERFLIKHPNNVGSFIEKLVSTEDISRTFDDSNIHFERTNEFNQVFLLSQQNYFNHRLQAKDHVFLNEVYDALGFERTRPGAIHGWMYESEGMGYIDFGLASEENKPFIDDIRAEAVLTFNVDGVIFDKI